MSKILVCYKWVIDEADIKVNSDLTVDFSRAKRKISDYDKNTIEAGARAATASGATTAGLSCGGAETKKSFGDALARGLDEGIWVNTADAVLDGVKTARLIAAAVKNTEDVSLVLCSEGSSDEYARQTGPRIASLLDWAAVTSVISFEVKDDTVIATRKLETSTQTVCAKLPCIISVLPEAAPAPIPGLKQVMAARKKPVAEHNPETLGIDMSSPFEPASLRGYVSERGNVIISGDTKEQVIDALVAAMRKEGVV